MAQSLQFFRRIMLLLNVTVGAFLVWVFGMTPVLAARQSDGVTFAQNLSALPAKPWTLTIAVLGMAALILAGVLRRRGQSFIGWIEPLFALCVIFALHLAYNGLLLYVVVDLIDGLHGRTRRRFLGAMTALFLLTGLGALQGALHVVPFSEYLLYFDMHTRQLLQSVVDLLGALHLILFVVYMVVLIGQRTEENSAIRRLNGELEQANDRLSVMNEQLKAYAAESERMAETRERNRLAREIHDTLGHALTGITAGADACIQMLEISPEMAKKQMERIASTAREGMNEVRRSVRALRPDALERMQLTRRCREAVRRNADDLAGRDHARFADRGSAPVAGRGGRGIPHRAGEHHERHPARTRDGGARAHRGGGAPPRHYGNRQRLRLREDRAGLWSAAYA